MNNKANFILKADECIAHEQKLNLCKLIKDSTGLDLRKSKEIADDTFTGGYTGISLYTMIDVQYGFLWNRLEQVKEDEAAPYIPEPVNYIEKVKEFHNVFEMPVKNYKQEGCIHPTRAKLRLNLLFEELKELAEAFGEGAHFNELCETEASKEVVTKGRFDLVEQADALADLQYVLSGAILETGIHPIFDEVFNEVHRSNMTKAVKDEDELHATQEKYLNQNIITSCFSAKPFPKAVYRGIDDKVLKSINYEEAKLGVIVSKL